MVDPIQSVKGKVVIDAFRTVDPALMMSDEEFQQHTSNIGMLKKPSVQALYNNLNKQYFSIVIGYSKNPNEQEMLLNLYKNKWLDSLKMRSSEHIDKENKKSLNVILLENRKTQLGND